MKLNLNEVLLSLDGKELDDGDKSLTVGISLARILVTGSNKDALRAYVLGKKLMDAEEVELDASEVNFIKTAIEENQTYTVLVKGQLLEKLTS